MFEPVPRYTHDCSKETASQLLNSFMKIVLSEANRYGINMLNRFIAMLDCCNYLNQLMINQKGNLWKRPAKEPIPAFQDVFQLFIYALSDQGLLFDGIGSLHESPDIDYWEQSASAYHQLALAMRKRNFAYLEIQFLKKLFDDHNNQQYLYGEPKKQSQTGFEVLQLSHMKEMLHKANISAADEILKNALIQMNNDHLLKITAPLYLFFAIKSNNAYYTAQDFRTALKANTQLFQAQKQPKQIKCAVLDCNLFYTLLNAVWWNPNPTLQPDLLLFDPFAQRYFH